jgi:hypothetical protein
MMWFSWLSQSRKVDHRTINFPNRSRSYDATRQGVRFWGYDRSMEASFLLSVEALRRIAPGVQFEAADLLHAFDLNRERIYAAAARVYGRGRKGSYNLVAADVS